MVVRRFDVFANPGRSSARTIPWLLVVQSDLLDAMDTCVVLPLATMAAARGAASERLNPILQVQGTTAVQLTQLIGSVPVQSLRQPVANLQEQQEPILRALDFLFSGI